MQWRAWQYPALGFEGDRIKMLSHVRVIDLTTGGEQIGGQMLGDLGADVILVEPPGGSRSRFVGPYVDDEPGPERSLNFWGWNRNKRSVVADLDSDEGRERLRRLIRNADIVLESFAPGYLDSIGLGYEALAALNPRVVVTSITPYGSTGPKAHWAASDLTVLASSCVMQITGDDDRAPCRVAVPQAMLHAGADAAAASLLAYYAAAHDGVGQWVDVSAQASTAMATQAFILAAAWESTEISRLAGGLALGPLSLKLVNPAKDGYVSVTFLFGTAIGPFSRRLMEVMCEQGFVDEATRDKDWVMYPQLLISGQEPVSELLRCQQHIAEFTAAHTKAELMDLAMQRGLLIVPVATTEDIVKSEQLAARDYWVEMEHPELGRKVVYPGAFAKLSKTPLKHRLRPPRLGEHDAEVAATVEQEAPNHSAAAAAPAQRALPLDGVKVLDLMWVMAGPASTRYLADYGATVVRVESTVHVDTARTLQPFPKDVPGPNNSGLFATMNAGKLGLTLNPANECARATIEKLVQWADVVTESFATGAAARLGLDYESVRKINPSVIMLSSCLNGQAGPLAKLAGFGTMGAQLAGFGELAGWADRPPAGPFGAYTDYVAPKFTVAALVAALEHRRRTGEGQYIDLSQGEASLHFLAPAFLDYTVNGRVMKRDGNASPEWSPHAVFPAEGEDRWVAIACETEEQWQALCRAAGADWTGDPRFATVESRLENREPLEAAIGAWTRGCSQSDLEQTLQAVGVPVAAVQRSSDALQDPQLLHREYFKWVEHPELGKVAVENTRFIMSATPGRVERPGPVFGQDNEYVLREILGLSEDEVTDLLVGGALE